jgi:hypothetical protein
MAAIYSNGGNRWNILGFNFTKRDVLYSLYKLSMVGKQCLIYMSGKSSSRVIVQNLIIISKTILKKSDRHYQKRYGKLTSNVEADSY